MIYSLVFQLPYGLLGCNDIVFVVFYGVNDIIIGNTTFHDVIHGLLRASLTTIYYIFQPFEIVTLEDFNAKTFTFYSIVIE